MEDYIYGNINILNIFKNEILQLGSVPLKCKNTGSQSKPICIIGYKYFMYIKDFFLLFFIIWIQMKL